MLLQERGAIRRKAAALRYRKTILKGLHQAVEQNILSENKRPGTSTEYSFKPVEEWKSEPVVHIKDIRTKKVIEFPIIQNTEEVGNELQLTLTGSPVTYGGKPAFSAGLTSNLGVVHNMDDHETDSNNVIVINNLKEQQEEVSIPATDTPTIWRRNHDATRYCQIPPIYDQEIGVEIQRQMDSEGLTAQSVVKRAIALTKVPLMLLELWANIGTALANSSLKVQQEPSSQPSVVLVSLQLSKTLEVIGVNLSPRQLQKCVTEYGEDVMLSAANELKRTGVLTGKANPTGYFVGCLIISD